MGNLTTITIHNDSCHEIEKNPIGFAEEVMTACSGGRLGGFRGNQIRTGSAIAQRPVHSSATVIYVCSGNTMTEMSSYRDEIQIMCKQNPEFFDKMLDRMDEEVKRLKKLKKECRGARLGNKTGITS